MTTTVINIKDAPSDWLDRPDEFVYIGRKGKGLSGKYGNPFPLHFESERTLVLSSYRNWFNRMVSGEHSNSVDFLESIWDLSGKTLVCFCKPRPCHGDVIAEFLNESS